MGLSIQTRTVNVVKVESFQQLLIPCVEVLTTCRLRVSVASPLPMREYLRVHKVTCHHELNLTVLHRPIFEVHGWVSQQYPFQIYHFIFIQSIVVRNLRRQVRNVLPGIRLPR